ncbi:MAG: hypothetical protein R3199_03595 [Gemmatimonadota bacterium]|nr:hypothetical protein [Gemmatimonadota bacterium]
MILYWTTLAVVLAVVLALAGFLVAIAAELIRAKRNVADLADGLEAVAGHTDPLEEKVDAIADALARLVEDFEAADEHLAGVARTFER